MPLVVLSLGSDSCGHKRAFNISAFNSGSDASVKVKLTVGLGAVL